MLSVKETARSFAIAAHGNQLYGHLPYVEHLDQVADLVKEYGTDAQIVAYLHDVLEDTPVTGYDIQQSFGRFIRVCVELITDPVGQTRNDRKVKLYRLLSAVINEKFNIALIVKTADRLANVRSSYVNNPRLFRTYQVEHILFKKAVYRPNLCDDMWNELDNLLQ